MVAGEVGQVGDKCVVRQRKTSFWAISGAFLRAVYPPSHAPCAMLCRVPVLSDADRCLAIHDRCASPGRQLHWPGHEHCGTPTGLDGRAEQRRPRGILGLGLILSVSPFSSRPDSGFNINKDRNPRWFLARCERALACSVPSKALAICLAGIAHRCVIFDGRRRTSPSGLPQRRDWRARVAQGI